MAETLIIREAISLQIKWDCYSRLLNSDINDRHYNRRIYSEMNDSVTLKTNDYLS